MTPQAIAQIAGDTAAIAIALLGWWVSVRTYKTTLEALAAENRRLVEALSRAIENGVVRPQAQQQPPQGEWRRAP